MKNPYTIIKATSLSILSGTVLLVTPDADASHFDLKTPTLFVGFGIGGEYGLHDYDFQDIGVNEWEPYKIGNSKDLNNNDQVNGVGSMTAGMRFPVKDSLFVGFGVDASFGNHSATYKKGEHEYSQEIFYDQGQPIYDMNLSKAPFTVGIKKQYTIGGNVHFGHQSADKRFYVKLSIDYSQLNYSFGTSHVDYMKSGFNDKQCNYVAIRPGLGAEYKISPKVWLGLELSVPVYNNQTKISHWFTDKYGQKNEMIPVLSGKSMFIQLGINVKYEF